MDVTTRLATVADAAAIARIYNQGIEERIATFETEPRSPAQIEAQLTEKGDRHPTIVVERGGDILAWAGAGPYRTREAYAGVAEHSVYTALGARGTGAGRAALEALIRAYEARGFWSSSPGSSRENQASLALHEQARHRVVGVYRRHAQGCDGQWRQAQLHGGEAAGVHRRRMTRSVPGPSGPE